MGCQQRAAQAAAARKCLGPGCARSNRRSHLTGPHSFMDDTETVVQSFIKVSKYDRRSGYPVQTGKGPSARIAGDKA
jgi:hypothetical protein